MGPISVTIDRGGVVEARHLVHGVVVRGEGREAAVGDPRQVAYWRSAAKPFQALPLVRAAPELPVKELAIACASHEARPDQLALVRSLLARSGAGVDDLECGPENGSRLRHNCSGKHAGMLLVCARRGWPRAGYRLPSHPLQQEIADVVAAACGHERAAIPTAADGCAVVTFALPLDAMATAFARLAALDGAGAVLDAMCSYPDLVGGPDSVDTQLMRLRSGLVAKRGAEGLLCGRLPDGAGFALKADDGAQRPLLAAACLLLGIDDGVESPLVNSRGEPIGRIVAS